MPRGRRPHSTLAPTPSEEALLQALPHTITTDTPLEGFVDGAGGLLTQAGDAALSQARQRGKQVNYVQHTTSSRVTLYDAHGESHVVPVDNLSLCLHSGLSVRCPLCNQTHADDSPNACPAQEPLLYTRCPICRTHGVERLIYEDRLHAEDQSDADDEDENYIKPPMPDRQSREKQLANKLTQHMLAYHKSEAGQLYGLSSSGD